MKKENKEYAKKVEQKIKCDVESCKHQSTDTGCCCLKEIKVSCSCGCNEAEEKDVTICESFECDCSKTKETE